MNKMRNRSTEAWEEVDPGGRVTVKLRGNTEKGMGES